jgi:hypothetical protein
VAGEEKAPSFSLIHKGMKGGFKFCATSVEFKIRASGKKQEKGKAGLQALPFLHFGL